MPNSPADALPRSLLATLPAHDLEALRGGLEWLATAPTEALAALWLAEAPVGALRGLRADLAKYNDAQERDDHGRFGAGGGGDSPHAGAHASPDADAARAASDKQLAGGRPEWQMYEYATNYLGEHYRDWFVGTPEAQQNAYGEWQSIYGYQAINAYLRTGTVPDRMEGHVIFEGAAGGPSDISMSTAGTAYSQENTAALVSNLRDMFASAPPTTEPITAWRGIDSRDVSFDPASLKMGDIVTDKGIVATSLTPYDAHEFQTYATEVRTQIVIPTGTRAITDGVSSELDLPPGTRMQVTFPLHDGRIAFKVLP